MKDYIIAVGSYDVGFTPPMPFVGKRFDGSKFTVLARLWLEIALVRCGFDVFDKKALLSEGQLPDFVLQANRAGADCIAVMSYGAFGSGKSFNDFCGAVIKYSVGRNCKKSRELAEDVCAKVCGIKKCDTAQSDLAFNGAACPAVVLEGGYLTEFDEAKAVYDPDCARVFAEHAAMGICEYFGMPYIPPTHDDVYNELIHASTGKRGKKIKILQAALCAAGYQTDVDGVFGKNTELAVKEFAINNGCGDGITQNLLHYLLFSQCDDIALGSKCASVLYLQRKLISKLYASPETSVMDEQTSVALSEFLSETESDETPLLQNDTVPKAVIKLLSTIGGGRPRLF